MTAAKLAVQLMILILLGLLSVRLGLVKGDFDKQFTALIMKLFIPCMIVRSMSGAFSWQEVKNCGRLVLIALALWAVTFLLGQLAYVLSGRSATGRIQRFNMLYTNFTFVGIPVVEALYGSTGVFYFVVFLVPYRMIYYSSAPALLSPPGLVREKQTLPQRLKGWFSPPVVAVFVGLFLYLTQIQLPSPVAGVVNSLGSCASPMGMLLCGMSLGHYEFKKILKPRYLVFPAVRNLLLPAVTMGLAALVGLERELAQVVVMFAALPTASLLAAFTIQYDPDQEVQFEAAACVMLSTLFSAVTIPLWANLIPLVFH